MGSSSSMPSRGSNQSAIDYINSLDPSSDDLSKETRGNIMTNQTNLEIAKQTNDVNLSIANQNAALQREQQAYERQLQQQIFQREDNAIQRQVSDSRAAGVSPLSGLQGAQTSSTAVNTTVPQNGFTAQGATMQQGSFGSAADERMQRALQVTQMINAFVKNTADTANTLQEMRFNDASMTDRLDILKWRAANEYGKAVDFASSRGYNESFGLSPNMSDKERFARMLIGSLIGHDKMSSTGSYDFGNGRSINFRYPAQLDYDTLRKVAKEQFDIDIDALLSSVKQSSSVSPVVKNVVQDATKVVESGSKVVGSLVKPLTSGELEKRIDEASKKDNLFKRLYRKLTKKDVK